MKGQGFLRRLGYARAGIVTAIRRERSMRTHGAAVIAVIVFMGATGAPALWWALVGLAVGLVLFGVSAGLMIVAGLGNMPWVKQNLSVLILGIIVVSLIPVAVGYVKHRAAA